MKYCIVFLFVIEQVLMECFIINSKIKRPAQYFTQGLFFDSPTTLIESSGLYRKSFIQRIDASTGETLLKTNLEDQYFGEGCTKFEDKIYQLTWKERKCFIYNTDLVLIETKDLMPNISEGWGATSDSNYLYFSDGTSYIYVINPKKWEIVRTITVHYPGGLKPTYINALQYVDGYIYANIYQSNIIIKINLETGLINAKYNLKDLDKINEEAYTEFHDKRNDVLNGIAYNEQSKEFYVTGKRWNYIFKITFEESSECVLEASIESYSPHNSVISAISLIILVALLL